MKGYEFVDITTADIAFIAYGKTLSELFSNAAIAMFEVIVDMNSVEKKEERVVEVEGSDLESLMFNWLNNLLVFVDSEGLVFSSFDVNVDEKNMKLKAVCRGERIDKSRHEVRTQVKAATYHKMKIERNDVWKAQVILDI